MFDAYLLMWEKYPLWVNVLYYLIILLCLISQWIIFNKANKPGWASIIPIYSTVVMCQIAGKPAWWVILMLIPIVNIVIICMVTYDFLKAFGKGLGYFFGMIFLPFIFLPILAFGKAQYIGVSIPAMPIAPLPPVNPPVNPPASTPGQ